MIGFGAVPSGTRECSAEPDNLERAPQGALLFRGGQVGRACVALRGDRQEGILIDLVFVNSGCTPADKSMLPTHRASQGLKQAQIKFPAPALAVKIHSGHPSNAGAFRSANVSLGECYVAGGSDRQQSP